MSQSRPADTRPYTPPDRRRRIGFVLGVVCFWGSLYVYIPTLAVFAGSIGASLSVIGFIVAAYGFVQFLLRIPVGYLSDRTGKRVPFIIAGLAATAIGDAGMALLSTPWMLVFWRGVHGIGAASFVPLSVYFAGFFRPRKRYARHGSHGCFDIGNPGVRQSPRRQAGGHVWRNFHVLGRGRLRRRRDHCDGRGRRASDNRRIARCRFAVLEE